jgi:AraC family ethanolamine operon transcriptional activator
MKIPPVFQSCLFHDFDFFAESICHGDVRYQQLSAGQFNGSLRQIVRKRLILSLHEMNQFILQEGSAIEGYITFLIPGDMLQDFTWRSNQLKGNVIGVLQGKMEHHSVTHPNFFGMPVSIEEHFIDELAVALGYEDFTKIISSRECFMVDQNELNAIRARIQEVFRDYSKMDDSWEEELAAALIRLLSVFSRSQPRQMGKTRRRIHQKAVRYMKEHMTEPISILEVAHAVGVSERNLRYAFHEVSKMSPKRFFDHIRLNHVRRSLKSGHFRNVIDVSNAYGFWHSGKFASDYKSLFYEYPSESLKQSAAGSQ